MENKKTINVNFGTVICVFIIFILILVIIGMYFYYNSNNTINTNTNNQLLSSINNSYTPKQEFKIGKYQIIPDKNILDEEYFEMANYGDETIEFKDNNNFKAYLGWGSSISGTYTISEDKIICTTGTFYTDNAPDQEVNISFTFKIINNSEIEITKAPDSYTIYTADFTNHSLTNETKEMTLSPFVVGIKFKIAK